MVIHLHQALTLNKKKCSHPTSSKYLVNIVNIFMFVINQSFVEMAVNLKKLFYNKSKMINMYHKCPQNRLNFSKDRYTCT